MFSRLFFWDRNFFRISKKNLNFFDIFFGIFKSKWCLALCFVLLVQWTLKNSKRFCDANGCISRLLFWDWNYHILKKKSILLLMTFLFDSICFLICRPIITYFCRSESSKNSKLFQSLLLCFSSVFLRLDTSYFQKVVNIFLTTIFFDFYSFRINWPLIRCCSLSKCS